MGDGMSDPEMALASVGRSKHRTFPACNMVGRDTWDQHKQLLSYYSNRIQDGTEIAVHASGAHCEFR